MMYTCFIVGLILLYVCMGAWKYIPIKAKHHDVYVSTGWARVEDWGKR